MKTFNPVKPQSRLEFIDILRGFALFGVLTANLVSFSGYSPDPANYSDFLDVAILVGIQFFVRAKFYSLFSFLFGWGMSVQMLNAAKKGHHFRPVFMRRMAILLIFGMIHGMVIWSGDILTLYAILGFALLLFRKRSERVLLITAVFLLLFAIIFNLPNDIIDAFRTWYANLTEFMRFGNLPNSVLATGSMGEIVRKTTQDYWAAQSWFIYYVGSVFSMFIVGLYVGKRQIFQNIEDHLPLLRRTLIIGLIVGVIFNGIFVWTTLHPEWIGPQYSRIVGIGSRTIGAPALMLFYVSGLVLLLRREVWLERLRPLGNVGRMALSNYLMQSVVCVLIFYGYGLGLYGKTDPSFGLLVTVLLFAAQIRTSAWHLDNHQFGPMEWLWRTLTYGRRQPWSHHETYENMQPNRVLAALKQPKPLVRLAIIAAIMALLASAFFLRYRSSDGSLASDGNPFSLASQPAATAKPVRATAVPDETQEPKPIATPSVAPVAYNPGPLAQAGDVAALAEAFDADRALAQIEVLSGEPYNGRYAASAGGLAAGDYLAEQFAALGLQPAGENGTFFQSFPISYTNLSAVPQFSLTQADGTVNDSYVLYVDYAPLIREFVGAGSGSGDVVWLNQCSPNDFSQLTVEGKMVLCQPEPGYEPFMLANRAAVENGAAGLLLVTDPSQRPPDMGDRFSHAWIPEPIPALRVYPDVVDDLFAGSGATFTETVALAAPKLMASQVDLTVETLGYGACPFVPPTAGCTARNVLAVLPGRDPAFADEVVIIGAHYDHLGNAPSEDGTRTVWAGANDDASGTAVLLEIARVWQAQGVVPRRTVLFAAWDAEELGLLGSTYYVQNPQYPPENIVAELQLDMVGAGGDVLYVDGSGEWTAALQALGAALEIPMAQTNLGRSDHVPFIQAGIPAALLIWLDENGGVPTEHYHRPADTPSVIDLDKLDAVGVLATTAVLNLAESEPAILALLADRETAASDNNLAAFLNTSSADQTAVDTAWFNDLQAQNLLTVTLATSNLQMHDNTAVGDTTIQATIDTANGLQTVQGQLTTQFARTADGWRWQGPHLAEVEGDGVVVRYPANIEGDLSGLTTAVRSQYAHIAETVGVPTDTPLTLQLFPDAEALRTTTALFMPETQQTWVGPGLVQMVYTAGLTETIATCNASSPTCPAHALVQVALANNGITEASAPWLWHGLPLAMQAETDSIRVQSAQIAQLYEAFAADQAIPQEAAAWAATTYALQQVGWAGLLDWQQSDAWERDWRTRLTAVQSDLDSLLSQRTAAILAQNETAFLQTAVPELSVAQRRWLADLEMNPLNTFSQTAVPLAFLEDGSVLAQVTLAYELAGRVPSSADVVIRFEPEADGILWAGKYLHELEGETAVVRYPEGYKETAVDFQRKASEWTPQLAALLTISPTLPIAIELYDAPDDLRAAIALPYSARNWTEPGQAIKLQTTAEANADDGVLVTQLTRQLLYQAGVTDEWLLRGIPAFVSARFDGGLTRQQLLAQWPVLKTAVAENTLIDLATIAPSLEMAQQADGLAEIEAWDAVTYAVQTLGWERLLAQATGGGQSFNVADFQDQWAASLAQDHIQPEWVALAAGFDEAATLAHSDYFASAALAGRATGSDGAALAADTIAEAFQAAGLQPAGDKGTFFQAVPVTVSQTIPPIRFEIETPEGETAVFAYRDEFLPVSPTVGEALISGELFYMQKGAAYGDVDFGGGIVVRNPVAPVAEEVAQAIAHNAGALILIGIKRDDVDLYGKTPESILPISEIPVLELTQDGYTRFLDSFGLDRNSVKKLLPVQSLETDGLVQFAIAPAQPTTTHNVLAVLPGSDPLLSQEVVVVSAHYDYVGDDDDGRRYGGANAASGVAAMLEIANLWQKVGYQPQRTVLFAAWGGQELGNVGSTYYAENPRFPLAATTALVQLDGIGGGAGFALGAEGDALQDGRLISGLETAVSLLDEKVVPTSRTTHSDHLAFSDAGFPTLLISWRLAGDENMSDEVGYAVKPENLRVSGQAAALLLMSLAQ